MIDGVSLVGFLFGIDIIGLSLVGLVFGIEVISPPRPLLGDDPIDIKVLLIGLGVDCIDPTDVNDFCFTMRFLLLPTEDIDSCTDLGDWYSDLNDTLGISIDFTTFDVIVCDELL